jgi:Zn-dependent peptidase ImmA (M78 family)/DNA-binding XRE family transcriptional regulator
MDEGIGPALVAGRHRTGFTQHDVANALGVSRAMVSYWEAGTRTPNDRQLAGMADLYRLSVDALVTGGASADADLAEMMFRGAEDELPEDARPGLREFVDFLGTYAVLSEAADRPLHSLVQSPFVTGDFSSEEEARRKAEELRAMVRLGLGPIPDMDDLCDLLGVTVFRAALGPDLSKTISGAFFKHPAVGFSILVNLEMTPGRRRFAIAHELAHAFFHSGDEPYVLSFSKKSPKERFADHFAGELLMPAEGVRRVLDERGISGRISTAAEVIHLQRFFRVSYPTALVRLKNARLLSSEDYRAFQSVRPVKAALSLGYDIDDDEWGQDPEEWRIARYPRRFLALVRDAIQRDIISPSTAAAAMHLSTDEILDFVGNSWGDGEAAPENVQELEEYLSTGVALA